SISLSTDTATTVIYTLSLHDALPIYLFWGRTSRFTCWKCSILHCIGIEYTREYAQVVNSGGVLGCSTNFIKSCRNHGREQPDNQDRKSTRLNSSHVKISYAVFCLKKK